MVEGKDTVIDAEGDFHGRTRGVISSLRAATLAEVFHDAVRALNPPLVQTGRGCGLLNAVVIDDAKTPEFWYCGAAVSSRSPPMSRYVHPSGETPQCQFCVVLLPYLLMAFTAVGDLGEVESERGHADVLTN
ncbi:hypothetical protein B0H11DRAFT_844267 [Mycena galericulata]|nr:hypothetical protein B0H11DRAFT_844267 [Mycena galericulata]